MDSKINLLQKKETVHKEVKRVIIVSISIFSVIFIITLGIVGFSLFRNTQYNALQLKEEEIRGKINQLSDKRDDILKLHDRLSAIETLIKNRKLIDARFIALSDIIPDGINLSEISITDQKILIRTEAPSLSDYNTLLDIFYKLDESQDIIKRLDGITNVQLSDFNASLRNNNYELEMSFEYGKGK